EQKDRHLRISVEDAGEGVAEHVRPYIFERFARGDDTAGSGLGLAIAKRLVEAHGGEIEAESEPGRGTTIRFTLPDR
ncbi:MAG: two-component system, OmpR family, phosphate regulon sensor histidine kinase PhoR, partial [Thermomicrobiales bacterium]|nr:two-component system, OmpR family, phosphate regulon sensor histidine kinase PhoR [Thermomicrobiales bacterium]